MCASPEHRVGSRRGFIKNGKNLLLFSESKKKCQNLHRRRGKTCEKHQICTKNKQKSLTERHPAYKI